MYVDRCTAAGPRVRREVKRYIPGYNECISPGRPVCALIALAALSLRRYAGPVLDKDYEKTYGVGDVPSPNGRALH